MEATSLIILLQYFLAPFSEDVPGTLCRNHSIQYRTALMNGTYWAVEMLDSSAKLQTGLLTGNLNFLGNYDECLNVKNPEFRGKYCLVRFEVSNDTEPEDTLGSLFNQVMDVEYKIHTGVRGCGKTTDQASQPIPAEGDCNYMRLGSLLSRGLRWGYCIPSSCQPHDLAIGLSDYLSAHITDVNVTVFGIGCSIKNDNYLPTINSGIEVFAAVVVCCLGIILIASTLYDLITGLYTFNTYCIFSVSVIKESIFKVGDKKTQPSLTAAPKVSRSQLNESQEVQSERARILPPKEFQIHTEGSSRPSTERSKGIYSENLIQMDDQLSSTSSSIDPIPGPSQREDIQDIRLETRIYKESRFRVDDTETQPLLTAASKVSRSQLYESQEVQNQRARTLSPKEFEIHTEGSSRPSTEMSKGIYSENLIQMDDQLPSTSSSIDPKPGPSQREDIQDIRLKTQIQMDEQIPSTSSSVDPKPGPSHREDIQDTSPDLRDPIAISIESENPSQQRATRQMTPLISPVKEASKSETDIMITFSVFSNGNRLFSFQNKKSSLTTLNGIKVISLVWAIVGQSYFVTISLPALNYISIKEVHDHSTHIT
ncbi:hypothetical protein C0J52_08657 [Blattella germanica]|nr:hypothetical protein C0J52_08657 [Blattella germanica]